MKKALLFSLLLALIGILPGLCDDAVKLEAFPGAEGYGRYVTGGRGGKVYHVTTLEDNNQPGSFRYAVNQSGTRTIVFDVSGNIHLTSDLTLRNGNVTIAGQTAPGDGICIADYPFSIRANNVIIRFVRFRLGNKYVTKDGADGWDALGSLDQRDIIVDHCSVSWSIDECLSFSGTHNTTVQWCIVSQSLVNSGHSKGGHGYGGNWGGEYGSYHHNLMAHHTSRTPRLGPRPSTQLNEVMDMRNNVLFNYSGESCYGGEGMNVNIVNNYYKPGPGNKYSGKTKETRIASVGIRTVDYCLDKSKIASSYNSALGANISSNSVSGSYVKGKPCVVIGGQTYEISDDNKITVDGKSVAISWNSYYPALHLVGTYYVDGNENSNVPSVKSDNWGLGVYDQISRYEICADDAAWANTKQNMKRELPIEYVYTTTHSTQDAYNKVLEYAGASLKRDALDNMIVKDAKSNSANSGTGSGLDRGFINVPEDVTYPSGTELDGVLPKLNSTAAKADTDGDGMPDEWETANGLDPNDATDGAKATSTGFTNLEVYINSLVAHIMEGGNAGGKMLNGELTYADAAVELPVYKPSGDDPGLVPGETFEWEISDITGNASGMTHKESPLPFKFGDIEVYCSRTDRTYNHGSGVTAEYIKFGSGNDWTIKLPAGKVANEVTFEGWSNAKDETASYIVYINDQQYSSTDHTFLINTNPASLHTIALAKPANEVKVKFGGAESVLKIRVKGTSEGSTGIEDVVVEPAGNGKIYNIMGIEVVEPLQPGIYIKDGRKFIVR